MEIGKIDYDKLLEQTDVRLSDICYMVSKGWITKLAKQVANEKNGVKEHPPTPAELSNIDLVGSIHMSFGKTKFTPYAIMAGNWDEIMLKGDIELDSEFILVNYSTWELIKGSGKKSGPEIPIFVIKGKSTDERFPGGYPDLKPKKITVHFRTTGQSIKRSCLLSLKASGIQIYSYLERIFAVPNYADMLLRYSKNVYKGENLLCFIDRNSQSLEEQGFIDPIMELVASTNGFKAFSSIPEEIGREEEKETLLNKASPALLQPVELTEEEAFLKAIAESTKSEKDVHPSSTYDPPSIKEHVLPNNKSPPHIENTLPVTTGAAQNGVLYLPRDELEKEFSDKYLAYTKAIQDHKLLFLQPTMEETLEILKGIEKNLLTNKTEPSLEIK